MRSKSILATLVVTGLITASSAIAQSNFPGDGDNSGDLGSNDLQSTLEVSFGNIVENNPGICDADDSSAALRANPEVKRILKSIKAAKAFLRAVFDANGADVKASVDDAITNAVDFGCTDYTDDPGDDFSDDPSGDGSN